MARMAGGQGDDFLNDVDMAIDGRIEFDGSKKKKKDGQGDTFIQDIRDQLFGKNKNDPVNGATVPTTPQEIDVPTPDGGVALTDMLTNPVGAITKAAVKKVSGSDSGGGETPGTPSSQDEVISGGKKLGWLDKVAQVLGGIF